MVRKLTFGFAVLAGIVVALGYIPGFHTIHHGAAAGQDERLLFGLFRLTMIDDITHGVTAIAALAASLTSRRASLLFLTANGLVFKPGRLAPVIAPKVDAIKRLQRAP